MVGTLLLMSTLGQSVLTINVSPDGPVSGLQEAVDQVRRLREPGQKAVIKLAAGSFAVERTVRFGRNDSDLEIIGSGESTKLQGGRSLDLWGPVTDPTIRERLRPEVRDRVRQADLIRAGIPEAGELKKRGFAINARPNALELFYRGVPLTLARYPNPGDPEKGWLRTGDAFDDGFVYNGDRTTGWKSWEDIWVYGYWVHDWAESHEKVASFDPAGGRITIRPPQSGYGYKSGRRFFFENVLEELDTPGEYFVDRKAGKAYILVAEPPKSGEVLASVNSGPLIDIDGAKNVRIGNLLMEGGRAEAISAKNVEGFVAARCTVRNFGGTGITVDGLRSGVENSRFTGIGEGAISIKGGDRTTLARGDCFANGNSIHHVSRWCRTYRPAVSVEGVGQKVIGNHFADLPHCAILFGGNDHLFERNLVERVCLETGDAGAFYMGRDATMRGTVIRHNRFREIEPTVNTEGNYTQVICVYLDDCSGGATIFGNVFEANGIGIMIGGGRDNKVENNVFLGCRPALSFDARGRGWAKGLFTRGGEWGYMEKIDAMKVDRPPYSTRYPELAKAIIEKADLSYPAGNTMVRNISFGGTWIHYLNGLKQTDLLYKGNVVSEKTASLAEALGKAPDGFQKIPLDRIGKP